VLASELEQLAHARKHGALLGRSADAHATPAAEVEQALVPKQAKRPQHRIAIDPELSGEVAGGREPLPVPRFAVCDSASDLGGDLLVQVGRLGAVDLDEKHGASNISFTG